MSYEEVREVLIWQVCQRNGWERDSEDAELAIEEVDWWLASPHIAVLSEDQKHPSSPWPSGCDLAAGFIRGTTIMWLDGYRRIVEKP